MTPRFRQLVDRNPSLADHVRTLEYIDFKHTRRGAPGLRRFRRVHSFTLGFKDIDIQRPGRQNWEKLSPSLRQTICSFIQANNIVNLCLRNIKNWPMSLFLHFPALSSLDIYRVGVANSPLPIPRPRAEVSPKLSSLSVGKGSIHTVWDLLGSGRAESGAIIDFTKLRQYPELSCFGNIASALTSGSLQTLKMIRLNPMLQTVEDDPYLHLTKELEAIACKNVLTELFITIEMVTDRACTTDRTKWAQLNRVLSIDNGFPFLRRVEVKIILGFPRYDWNILQWEFHRKIMDIGGSQFLWLLASEQINFTFAVV
ncbi:hypothetical protein M413DRAFT_10245 [Hebeloma cylindrosporum]|uniref:F-box domain-containing protein n=1 Tax=Hebeloma cylindrosporum TaxID=76867 RepID=A0A0C3CGP4_HEBCY|nr:hypothetical protein M413DRAFT_10245 [Hebeloma cylindrosporum h7]